MKMDWKSLCLTMALWIVPEQIATAHAAIGKGFVLGPAGTVTSEQGEVLAGRYSVKGSQSGPRTFAQILQTDPSIIRFGGGRSYRVTFRYRILAAPSQGFDFLFYSQAAAGVSDWLPGLSITGAAGSAGTREFTTTLKAYPDYQAIWTIPGTGAIVIDEIRIVDTATGAVVAAEAAEGPTLNPGVLKARIDDFRTFALAAAADGQLRVLRSLIARDLDGDGYPEAVVTTSTYPDQLPEPVLVLGARNGIALRSREVFQGSVPTLRHSPVTLFADLDGDGNEDMLFADAGLDRPPWTGSRIAAALNQTRGVFRNVTDLVPAEFDETRSYSLAAGDLDGDGKSEIVLPDQGNGRNTAMLRWNGQSFDAQRDWISPSLWVTPGRLNQQSWMGFHDLDRDGKQDLIVGGNTTTPNLSVLFGGDNGFAAENLVRLPDGPYGHTPWELQADPSRPMSQGADVNVVLIEDFNHDGWPDLFTLQEQAIYYQPGVLTDRDYPGQPGIFANGGYTYWDIGLQVLLNQGGSSRVFTDVTQASTQQSLGKRLYVAASTVDLNQDGFPDVVGIYATKPYGGDPGGAWGSTFFFNDGDGAFQVVDAAELLGSFVAASPGSERKWSPGAFLPTFVAARQTEGVVLATSPDGLELDAYKMSADATVGTGPGFSDPGPAGAPGFNEFYYLRHYPDAAEAVRSGQSSSGLAHYLAAGKAKGYRPSAHQP